MHHHRRYWAWYRRHYDAIWDSPATAAWAMFVADQVGGPVVADVGCGTGLASQAVRADGRMVFGVDAVPGMVRTALEWGRCTAGLEADAMRLPLASASVDGVLLANVLHVVPRPDLVLQEARRVLRPGGRIVACWPHDDIHPRTILRRDIRSGRPVRDALWAHALRILVGIPGSAAGVRKHRRAVLVSAVEDVMGPEDVLVRSEFDVVEVFAVRPRVESRDPVEPRHLVVDEGVSRALRTAARVRGSMAALSPCHTGVQADARAPKQPASEPAPRDQPGARWDTRPPHRGSPPEGTPLTKT